MISLGLVVIRLEEQVLCSMLYVYILIILLMILVIMVWITLRRSTADLVR